MLQGEIDITLIDLGIMWMIGLGALMVAINAHGIIRTALSWVITLAILTVPVFFTSLQVNNLKSTFLNGAPVAYEAPAEHAPAHVAPVQQAPPPPPAGESPEEIANYLNTARKLVDDAAQCSYSISIFDVDRLADASDVQYEKMESSARSLRNQSANIGRQIKQLRVPPRYADLHERLITAAEVLRVSGYSVHAYFGAEDASEESTHRNQFITSSRKAIADFKEFQAKFASIQ